MNRRHFLSTLAAAVAGSSYDPERALWTPGAKLISIPKPDPRDLAFLNEAIRRGWIEHMKVMSAWAEEELEQLEPWPISKTGHTTEVRSRVRAAVRGGQLVFEGGERKLFTFVPRLP